MARLNMPDPSTFSEHQRRVHDEIASGPRGRVRGPLAVWLNRPGLAEQAQALGQYCRYDSSLPPRLSELAILAMAVQWRAEFEWWAHKPIALKAGVSEAVVQAMRDGTDIPFERDDERIVHAFITTLTDTRQIPDALYEEALGTLGQDAIVDLVGLAGYYTLISMTLNVFAIEPPDGEPRELAQP
jgi:4-carboxymuconolactone decarboxylase